MTPEGRIKLAIRKVLDKYQDHVYYFMPVPGGYGKATLDYLGFACGIGFAIEAKREGGRPTRRQLVAIDQIQKSRTKVFVINSREAVDELDQWLGEITLRRDNLN